MARLYPERVEALLVHRAIRRARPEEREAVLRLLPKEMRELLVDWLARYDAVRRG